MTKEEIIKETLKYVRELNSFSEFCNLLSEETLKDILNELDYKLDPTKQENKSVYL